MDSGESGGGGRLGKENSVGTCDSEGPPHRQLDAGVCKPRDSGLLEQGRTGPVQIPAGVRKHRVFQYLLLPWGWLGRVFKNQHIFKIPPGNGVETA